MNTFTVNEPTGKLIEIESAWHSQSGYGHKQIKVVVYREKKTKIFTATTNNMPGFDAVTDMNLESEFDVRAYYFALYKLIESDIEERIAEWLLEIEEEENL